MLRETSIDDDRKSFGAVGKQFLPWSNVAVMLGFVAWNPNPFVDAQQQDWILEHEKHLRVR